MEPGNLREFFHRQCTGEGEEEDEIFVQVTINLSVLFRCDL